MTFCCAAYYYYYFTRLRVLNISVRWWFSTRVWVTANLFKSPGFFLVFWLISIMLYFGWFPFVLLFAIPPVSIPVFVHRTERSNYNWYHRHIHVPQLFQFSRKVKVFISLFAFFRFYPVVSRNGNARYAAGSLFLLSITWSGYLARLGDIFVSQNPRGVCASHFPGRMVQFKFLAQFPVNHIPYSVISSLILFFIFTNPSARLGYDTRSISKRSLTVLNSDFSFS